ncbi:MAG: glycerol-3-phosphate acyltransferase [Polyangia bacterium]
MDCSRYTLLIAGAALGSYLAGSVNFSVLASRLLGLGDPRRAGSGNAGATNLFRTAGMPVALGVLVLDLGRAAGVIWGGRTAGLEGLAPALALPLLLGNLFPVFHGFRGGKGVAATSGSMLAISPLALLCGGGLFLLLMASFRRVSLGSLAMCASFPLWLWLLDGSVTEIAVAGTLGAAMLVTHRANLARLVRGEEPRLGRSASEAKSE